jgi:NAD(P)-dependent dehydrogenase (short-subunit alcohol dehydrogenase family)
MTIIDGSVVLITGANGGLGTEFVAQALARGATKVYAAARTPREWEDARVIPITLDVTDAASVAAAAVLAADTSIVINNAGITSSESMTTGGFADIRAVFETNFFGALAVARDFAPVLSGNGGGAIVNVLSVLSWIGLAGTYSATKAALWSATNSLRIDLAGQGTQVVGLHVGYTDTPMTRNITAPKNDPADIVRLAYDGLEAGDYEVLADELSRQVKQGLAGPIGALYPQFAREDS